MTLVLDFRQKAAEIWHVQRIKTLVRTHMGLAPKVLISVVEIDCDDEICPGPATQITILTLDFVRRVFVIHRPLTEVTADDLPPVRR
jgi:hypothetical protein